MRRIACALLSVLFCISLLASCTSIKDDDATVIAAAEKLIERAEITNRIYWGKGIDKTPSGETLAGNSAYVLADVNSVIGHGITDYNSLKEYTRSVYSMNECDNIFSTYLTYSAYTGEALGYNYTEIYTRYLSDSQGRLYVRDGLDDLIGDTRVEWDFSSMRVVERSRKTVTLTVGVNVSSSYDAQGYRDEMNIELRYEDGEYRLNTPTYCKYDRG